MYEAGAFGDWLPDEFMGSMSDQISKLVKWPPTVRPSLLGPVRSKIRFTRKVVNAKHFPIPQMTPWWQPAVTKFSQW